MRTLNRRLPALLPLALFLACRHDSAGVVFQFQAHSFANSEWEASTSGSRGAPHSTARGRNR